MNKSVETETLNMNHWYGPDKFNPDNKTPFLTWINKKTK